MISGPRMIWTRNGYEVVTDNGEIVSTSTVNVLVEQVGELQKIVEQQQKQIDALNKSVHDILLGMRYST